jgi:hypothetical protein
MHHRLVARKREPLWVRVKQSQSVPANSSKSGASEAADAENGEGDFHCVPYKIRKVIMDVYKRAIESSGDGGVVEENVARGAAEHLHQLFQGTEPRQIALVLSGEHSFV